MDKQRSKKMWMIIWKQLVHNKETIIVKKVNAVKLQWIRKKNHKVHQQGLYAENARLALCQTGKGLQIQETNPSAEPTQQEHNCKMNISSSLFWLTTTSKRLKCIISKFMLQI